MKGITTVWFDTETGGVEDHHPTIQVACVVERDWIELETFEAKIKFNPAQADPEALALNHYSDEVWKLHSITEGEAVSLLASIFNRHREIEKVSKSSGRPYSVARLGGHNIATFDGPRLVAMFQRFDRFFPAACYESLDTMHLARWHALRLAKPPANLKLPTLCDFFGIPNPNAHDALADVRSSISIARAILDPITTSRSTECEGC